MISVNGWDLLPLYEFAQVLRFLAKHRLPADHLAALMNGDPHTKRAEVRVRKELVQAVDQLPRKTPEGIRGALVQMRDILVNQAYPPLPKGSTLEEDKAAFLAWGITEKQWNESMRRLAKEERDAHRSPRAKGRSRKWSTLCNRCASTDAGETARPSLGQANWSYSPLSIFDTTGSLMKRFALSSTPNRREPPEAWRDGWRISLKAGKRRSDDRIVPKLPPPP